MNKIREIDLKGNVVICEAGVILENIQKLSDENDRLFPLALGSQGSCQIGGNIATNAGGTGVLAYGNTRALVMGLEVVLPSGEIWNGLRRLKKDNTGYDLKDLFIGSEGTLGIITAAVLKLFPKPRGKSVAFCGLQSPDHALQLLDKASSYAGQSLTAFELMAHNPLDFTLKHFDTVRNPLDKLYPWHVLLEISSNRSQEDADETIQAILEASFEATAIEDAALSTSISQVQDFWRIREMMPVAQKYEGTFGHLGDGNMHYNISQPVDAQADDFLKRQPEINTMIHDLVVSMDGSVAAEHGVGQLKRDLIARTKNKVELDLMHTIKKALDPNKLINPGKIL